MAKKNKTAKKQQEKDLKLPKYQANSMLFLCGALIYFILAHGMSEPIGYFPNTIIAPVVHKTGEIKKKNSAFPTELGEVSLGSQLDKQQRIEKPKKSFSSNSEAIYFSVELINPNKDEEIQGQFHYYGYKQTDPVLLSSSSIKIADKSQDVVVFTFARPGSQWQLKGTFKATALIPSSNTQEEITFTIY